MERITWIIFICVGIIFVILYFLYLKKCRGNKYHQVNSKKIIKKDCKSFYERTKTDTFSDFTNDSDITPPKETKRKK